MFLHVPLLLQIAKFPTGRKSHVGSKKKKKLIHIDTSAWGKCSPSCGPGQQSRSRTVTTAKKGDGKACPSLEASRDCNDGACAAAKRDCVVGEWSGYGFCTRDCGGGQQIREREVVTAATGGGGCVALREARACNEHEWCVLCR